MAPDYVLVDEKVKQQFIDHLQVAITEFYGNDPHQSDSYARIVSDRHFTRLTALLGDGKAVVGGENIADERYIAPTVLDNVALSSQVMTEEIFGPILPIISVSSTEEAIRYVASHDHPLALYVFAEKKSVVDDVLAQTTAGGVTVNGTIMHLTSPHLPFGGVGESGMGGYHGKSGVRLFQHMKPVLARGTKMDPSLAYPPYTARKAKIFRKIL